MFQDPSLDQDLTAWENLDLHGALYHVPGAARRERAEMLLTDLANVQMELHSGLTALVREVEKLRQAQEWDRRPQDQQSHKAA